MSRFVKTSDAQFPEHLCRSRGATVLTNLSASNITIGKAEYRRDSAHPSRAVYRGLSLLGSGTRRVHDRSRLGRARDGLRERRTTG